MATFPACSQAHQSLRTFQPSTWCADVAAPQRNPRGKVKFAELLGASLFSGSGAGAPAAGGPGDMGPGQLGALTGSCTRPSLVSLVSCPRPAAGRGPRGVLDVTVRQGLTLRASFLARSIGYASPTLKE